MEWHCMQFELNLFLIKKKCNANGCKVLKICSHYGVGKKNSEKTQIWKKHFFIPLYLRIVQSTTYGTVWKKLLKSEVVLPKPYHPHWNQQTKVQAKFSHFDIMFQSLVTTDNLTKDHLLLHILQSELYKPRTQVKGPQTWMETM